MGVDLDNIHVHVFALGDLVSCDNVSHINNTIFITLISIVVKENVLGVVISLVNCQKFSSHI